MRDSGLSDSQYREYQKYMRARNKEQLNQIQNQIRASNHLSSFKLKNKISFLQKVKKILFSIKD